VETVTLPNTLYKINFNFDGWCIILKGGGGGTGGTGGTAGSGGAGNRQTDSQMYSEARKGKPAYNGTK